MSARREKRLRRLEGRVAYLETRMHSVEARQLEQREAAAYMDADYEQAREPARLGLLQKIRGYFRKGG